MRQTVSIVIVCLAIALTMGSCGNKFNRQDGVCYIHGVMESDAWDGKRIFLVPFEGVRDSNTVDSVVIKDGKFEFEADTAEMKIVRLDYHFRKGAQDILIITEPGDLDVFIGNDSRAGGTPQNDSMQVWKDGLMVFAKQYAAIKKEKSKVMTEGKEIQKKHRAFTRAVADRQPEGIFKDYLDKYYPAPKNNPKK